MSAPSTYTHSPHDGRLDMDLPEEVAGLVSSGTSSGRRGGDPFVARYPSPCASCPVKIVPGDGVAYGVDGQLEHLTCPEDLEIPRQGVCTDCSLVLTPAGKCSGWCE